MGPLARRATGYALVVSLGVLVVAAGAAIVRVLPWLLAPQVPIAVVAPFAQALAAAAAETSLLVGVPIGFALAASVAIEGGEVRALAALGCSPLTHLLRALPAALAFGALSLGTSLAWSPATDRPGLVATELLSAGRTACLDPDGPHTAWVPILKLSWLCFDGVAPRLVGALPNSGDNVWFSATGISASEDLERLTLADVKLTIPEGGSSPAVRLATASADVHGLPLWGRAAAAAPGFRAVLVALGTVLVALAAMAGVVFLELAKRWAGACVGASGGLSALVLVHELARRGVSAWGLALAAVGGMAVALVIAGVLRAASDPLQRWFRPART